jgi:hypothetical protein
VLPADLILCASTLLLPGSATKIPLSVSHLHNLHPTATSCILSVSYLYPISPYPVCLFPTPARQHHKHAVSVAVHHTRSPGRVLLNKPNRVLQRCSTRLKQQEIYSSSSSAALEQQWPGRVLLYKPDSVLQRGSTRLARHEDINSSSSSSSSSVAN